MISSNVQDKNYQTIGSKSTVLLHPSNYYVGYRANRKFCKPNQSVPIDLVVSNTEGKLIADVEIKIKIRRQKFFY